MLPSTIFGSVITAAGAVPFVLQVNTGKVAVGRHDPSDNRQASLAKDVLANIERQVSSQVAGARSVRIGWYQCSGCSTWVEVARKPSDWSGDRCSGCA